MIQKYRPTQLKPSSHETAISDAANIDAIKANRTRVLEAIADTKRGVEELDTLEKVQDKALSVLDILPEAQELAEQISAARKQGDRTKEAVLVERQKRIYDDLVAELCLVCGVESDEAKVSQENDHYRKLLADKLEGLDTEDGLLHKMGMIGQDGEGNEVFTFPRSSFPPHIVDKWDHYISTVKQHMHYIEQRNQGISNDTDLIAQLDFVRTAAHNSLSLSIQKFLDMDPEIWDLDKCRHLVIKMRDRTFPTKETAEKTVTAAEVRRLISITQAVSAHS